MKSKKNGKKTTMNVRRKNQKGGNKIVKFICRVLQKLGLSLKSCKKILENVDLNSLNEVLPHNIKSQNKFLENGDSNGLNEVLNEGLDNDIKSQITLSDLKKELKEMEIYRAEEKILNEMIMKIFKQLKIIKNTWEADRKKHYCYFEKNKEVETMKYLGIIQEIRISHNENVHASLLIDSDVELFKQFYNINDINLEVRIEECPYNENLLTHLEYTQECELLKGYIEWKKENTKKSRYSVEKLTQFLSLNDHFSNDKQHEFWETI